jgi:hypothetical protein
MNREDIIRMAREVHDGVVFMPEDLERFANLISAQEREACAKVAEDYWFYSRRDVFSINIAVREIAEKIRARSE